MIYLTTLKNNKNIKKMNFLVFSYIYIYNWYFILIIVLYSLNINLH